APETFQDDDDSYEDHDDRRGRRNGRGRGRGDDRDGDEYESSGNGRRGDRDRDRGDRDRGDRDRDRGDRDGRDRDRGDRGDRDRGRNRRSSPPQKIARIYVGSGTKDSFTREMLEKFLTDSCAVPSTEIKHFSLRPSYSFLDVREELGEKILNSTDPMKVGG